MKNVILFTIDTLRRDVFGCYGNEQNLTPFFDSIRDHMMIFDNMYSAGPYTQAAFPAILTSGYYMDFNKNPQPVLSPKRRLISEALKKNGIYTAGFHSNPYMSDFFGWNRGWNTFFDGIAGAVDVMYPYMRGYVINEKVKKWMNDYLAEDEYEPFFLWMHYMDVHEPYIPDSEDVAAVDPALASMTPQEMFDLYKGTVIPRDVSDAEKVATLKTLYQAHVREVDRNAKELFETLKEFEVLDDTIIIFTADHGDEFNDHGGLSHDGKFFDELVHVPFMIYDTDIKGEQHVDTLMSNIDIPPTIMKLFDLESDPKFKGKSLLPVEEYQPTGAFGEAIGKLKHQQQSTDKPAYYYTDGYYKVTYREEENAYALYDLKKDPGETQNIFDSCSESTKYAEIINGFANRNNV